MKSKNIGPKSSEFMDVIKHSIGRIGTTYVVQHSVVGVDASFDVGDYKIKIDATGMNATCEPAWFQVAFKDKDQTGVKLWIWKAEAKDK